MWLHVKGRHLGFHQGMTMLKGGLCELLGVRGSRVWSVLTLPSLLSSTGAGTWTSTAGGDSSAL